MLRGFCRTCQSPIKLKKIGNGYHLVHEPITVGLKEFIIHDPVPEWSLNAKQIRIIVESVEFSKWIQKRLDKEGEFQAWNSALVADMLETNPFLVNEILSREVKE